MICTVACAVVYIRAAGDGRGRVHIARAEHAVVAVVHIGGHEAVEAPLAAENVVHQLGGGAAPPSAYAVEAAHGSMGVALVCRHYAAECLEIDLADSLFVCPYSDAFAMRFAVVEGKVLFIHNKSLGLDAYALAGAYRGGDKGIFGVVLEVTAAVCVAVSVGRRTVYTVSVRRPAVFAYKFTDTLNKLLVPCGCAKYRRRMSGTRTHVAAAKGYVEARRAVFVLGRGFADRNHLCRSMLAP